MPHKKVWLEDTSLSQWLDHIYLKINEMPARHVNDAKSRIIRCYQSIVSVINELTFYDDDMIIQTFPSFGIDQGRLFILIPDDMIWAHAYEAIMKLEYIFICHMHRAVKIDKKSKDLVKEEALELLDAIRSDPSVYLRVSDDFSATIGANIKKNLSRFPYQLKSYLIQRINALYDQMLETNLNISINLLKKKTSGFNSADVYREIAKSIHLVTSEPDDEVVMRKSIQRQYKRILLDYNLDGSISYYDYLKSIFVWGWRYILCCLGCTIYYNQAMLIYSAAYSATLTPVPELIKQHDQIIERYSHERCWVPKYFLGEHYISCAQEDFRQRIMEV